VYLLTYGHFQSRDKDGDYTTGSPYSKKHMPGVIYDIHRHVRPLF